jgi:hypothetical protein
MDRGPRQRGTSRTEDPDRQELAGQRTVGWTEDPDRQELAGQRTVGWTEDPDREEHGAYYIMRNALA